METIKTGGLTIKEGVFIIVDPWTVHHNTEIWGDDAETFRPERLIQ